MNATMTVEGTTPRAARAALAIWTAATLVAVTGIMTYMQLFLMGADAPPLALMFGLPALLFAAPIVATRWRWRWAPLLGVLYWILFCAANAPYLGHDLLHPEFLTNFAIGVVLLALAVLGIVTGLGATLQNYRGATGAQAARRPAPAWFALVLSALLAGSLSALAVAALPRAGGAGVSAELLAGLPALTVAGNRFEQSELRVRAGETVALSLKNGDVAGHSFDVDEFNVHVSMPSGQPSLALFQPAKPGRYAFYCGVPGHREVGMTGTLIVEP